jgi:hypothetical protein
MQDLLVAMEQLSGFPFFLLEFNKAATLVKSQQVAELTCALQGGSFTDLIVISHGWNNDTTDAKALYARFLKTSRQLLEDGQLSSASSRRFVVLGVLWPSKKFAEAELIPGGAAGVEGVDDSALAASLRELQGFFDDSDADQTLARMEALVPRLEDSDKACAEFVTLARTLLSSSAGDGADGADLFFSLPAGDVFAKLEQPVSFTEATVSMPEAGKADDSSFAIESPLFANTGMDEHDGAASLGQWFRGIASAAGNVLNLTTYYQMKERAGLVGSVGLNPLLRKVRQEFPSLRLHLIGHSFGGRLVTAAMAGESEATMLQADSLALLQAAYSHYGLAKQWDGQHDGLFRRVLSGRALQGPAVITHTDNDKAVGVAYPLASLLGGQVAAGLGDATDKYGGIGRNGAQKTPEAVNETLKEVGTIYSFQTGRVHNLLADAYVHDHGDITGPEVVNAVFQAIG